MNDNIRQKLFQYSETPPPAAWNRIAAALDDTPAFAQRLHDFEQQPAADVWQKIDQQLPARAANVIPLRSQLFKYAIAAAVLIVMAAGSFFYFKSSTAPAIAPTAQQNVSNSSPKNSSEDTQTRSGSKTTVAQDEEQSDNNDPAVNGEQTGRTTVAYAHRVRIPKDQLAANTINVMPEEKNMVDASLADRYIIATTPTGKVVRLPKKAYSDYACAVAYQNYQCKERLAALQNKMAASVATDFTDFIDLLKKLQDNP